MTSWTPGRSSCLGLLVGTTVGAAMWLVVITIVWRRWVL